MFAEILISLIALPAFIKFNRTLKACSPASQWQISQAWIQLLVSMHCLVRHVQDIEHSHTVAYTVIERSATIGMLK